MDIIDKTLDRGFVILLNRKPLVDFKFPDFRSANSYALEYAKAHRGELGDDAQFHIVRINVRFVTHGQFTIKQLI